MHVKIKPAHLKKAALILETSRSIVLGGLEVSLLGLSPARYVSLQCRHAEVTLSTERVEEPPPPLADPSWVYFTCEAEVEMPGEVLVPAEDFLGLIRGLESNCLEVVLIGGRVELRSGSQQLSFPARCLCRNAWSDLKVNSFADTTLTTGLAFKANQLVLRRGLCTHARLPPPVDRSENTFLFFKNGRLHIGSCPIPDLPADAEDYICDAVALTAMPDGAVFIVPTSVRSLLIDLLAHDADVTVTTYENPTTLLIQTSFLFTNPGETPFFFHWVIT